MTDEPTADVTPPPDAPPGTRVPGAPESPRALRILGLANIAYALFSLTGVLLIFNTAERREHAQILYGKVMPFMMGIHGITALCLAAGGIGLLIGRRWGVTYSQVYAWAGFLLSILATVFQIRYHELADTGIPQAAHDHAKFTAAAAAWICAAAYPAVVLLVLRLYRPRNPLTERGDA